MEVKFKLKTIVVSLLLIVLFSGLIGVYIGRSTIEVSTTTKVEKLPERPIEIPPVVLPEIILPSTPLPERVLVKEPLNKQLLDSINKLNGLLNKAPEYVYIVDSAKVFKDYTALKLYKNLVMFDNEFGKYIVSYDVLFNELKRFYDTKLQPNKIVEEKIIKESATPFLEVGYTTSDFIQAGGGIILNKDKWGIRVNYQYDLDRSIKRDGVMINFIKTF